MIQGNMFMMSKQLNVPSRKSLKNSEPRDLKFWPIQTSAGRGGGKKLKMVLYFKNVIIKRLFYLHSTLVANVLPKNISKVNFFCCRNMSRVNFWLQKNRVQFWPLKNRQSTFLTTEKWACTMPSWKYVEKHYTFIVLVKIVFKLFCKFMLKVSNIFLIFHLFCMRKHAFDAYSIYRSFLIPKFI